MKFTRSLLLLAACLAFVASVAYAQAPVVNSGFVTNVPSSGVLVGPGGVPLVLSPSVLTPPVTQNTVTTTGPVKSETTISVGSFASQVLQWIMVAFGPVIGSMVVWVLVRVLKKLGIDATDALRARLMDIAVNGLNSEAKQIEANMEGMGKVEIKNAIVQQAVSYTQAHGAETIKALGLDPQSGAAVEAIKARIETAINDPTVPVPTVLSNPVPKA